MIGIKFNRWLVLTRSKNRGKELYYLCECDCGNKKEISKWSLIRETSKSCGCFNRERLSARKKTHGMSTTSIYYRYKNMRARCRNKNSPGYHRYGGRGISVCKRWNTFEKFFQDMGMPAPGQSIDRINNNGDYKPSNCRWASSKIQARNRRNNIFPSGKCLKDIAKEHQIKYATLYYRVAIRGLELNRALNMAKGSWIRTGSVKYSI